MQTEVFLRALCTMRGSVCVTHTYPAAEAMVCKTLRRAEAKDNR